MKGELAELLEFARELAALAEAEILPRFQRCGVALKPDGSEVTDADRAAEAAIRARIERDCPGHDVLGEEYGGPAETTADRCWLIDPIDGTASFTLGLPTFGTLIGLAERGEPLVGVIHMPALGESVFASRGGGCWLARRGAPPERIAVDPLERIAEATVSAPSVPEPGLARVSRAARKFRFVGDCVQHVLVCRGRVHAAIDPRLRAWDIAALVPCVEEAGGVITDLRGERSRLLEATSLLSSSTPALHRTVLRLLGDEPDGVPA